MALFSEFKPSGSADWRKQLEKDLKGDVYQSLVWHNENGIDIKPFYTREDLQNAYSPAFLHKDWDIAVQPKGKDAPTVNSALLRALAGGASSVWVDLRESDLEKTLREVQLQFIRATFIGGPAEANSLKSYLAKNYNGENLAFSLLCTSFKNEHDAQEQLQTASQFSNFTSASLLGIDVAWAHHRGCKAVFELALVLAQLAEFANSAGTKLKSLRFSVRMGVNSDYFVQMAKLRAVRRLWLLMQEQMGTSGDLQLLVETAEWNKSITDPYTNLLRSTVEAMAAVSGGCNELLVKGFDLYSEDEKKLSQRMAINQQLILKDECYFDKMGDVACGSYFIENLTDVLAVKALDLFKQIENKGGYFKYLNSGELENELQSQAEARKQSLKEQKEFLVGVNKFRHEKDVEINLKKDLERLRSLSVQRPALNFELDTLLNASHA